MVAEVAVADVEVAAAVAAVANPLFSTQISFRKSR